MNKAFEKILERLEELKLPFPDKCPSYYGDTNTLIDQVKQVVQEIAEEYNNGWIPCSEEMPAEHDSIFAKFKGTDKWNDGMFEKISDVVNVIVSDEEGSRTTTCDTIDGKWSCDLLKANKSYRITHWQPLPELPKERE